MRENSLIGPRPSIRAAAILVVLAIASLGPTLLAVQNAAGGDSPATDRAIASGARNGWEARPDSMLSRQWGARQFGRDYLDDRIHDISHRLAEIEREPDFAPIFKAVDPGSSTAAAFPLSFQIMGLISIAFSRLASRFADQHRAFPRRVGRGRAESAGVGGTSRQKRHARSAT